MKFIISSFLFFSIFMSCYSQYSPGYKCSNHKNTLNKSYIWFSDYDIKFAFIDVQVSNLNAEISGSVTYNAIAKTSISDLYFQLIAELNVDSVKVNDIISTFTRTGEVTSISVNPGLVENQSFEFQIFYHGTSVSTQQYRGLTQVLDDTYSMPVTYTLSESFHLKEWLPCKEDVIDKIDSTWTFITVDTSLKAGSAGVLKHVTSLGSGKHRFEWKTRHPMTYYLISLSVADYQEYNIYAHPVGISDSVLIQNYLYDHPNALPTVKADVDRTPFLIELYSQLFGLYPFYDEKYGHCQVKLNGAMEHQTMTTIGPLLDWVIGHELAHQWFGDYITCATWQDIWINEGFATYCEFLFYEGDNDVARQNSWVQDTYTRAMWEPYGSVFVPFSEIADEGRLFSYNLSYKKGASLLRMLRYVINNDSLFFGGIKNYVQLYANSNATGINFKEAMESYCSMNFNDFFNQWYFGEGFPIYDVLWKNENQNTVIDLSVQGTSSNTPFFGIPVQVKMSFNNSTDTIVRLNPTNANTSFTIPIGTRVCQSIEFDPGNFVIDSLRSIVQSVPTIQISHVNSFYNPQKNTIETFIPEASVLPAQIEIVSTTGKRIYVDSIIKNRSELNVSQLPEGVYVISISNKVLKYSYKFVKLNSDN